MERAAFLLEATGERLGCMLNPDHLLVQRTAGVRPRRSLGGPFTGAGLSDDPLLFTGGGTTELTLELLFDVSIGGSTVRATDVRELTAPLWRLAEGADTVSGRLRAPQVRFVWGKAWNVPGVVSSVAERLEHFTSGGAPRRSWLRMRLLRASEPEAPDAPGTQVPLAAGGARSGGAEALRVHEVLGAGPTDEGEPRGSGQRLDELAYLYYGDPGRWRTIARENGVDDPFALTGGAVLRIPPEDAR